MFDELELAASLQPSHPGMTTLAPISGVESATQATPAGTTSFLRRTFTLLSQISLSRAQIAGTDHPQP